MEEQLLRPTDNISARKISLSSQTFHIHTLTEATEVYKMSILPSTCLNVIENIWNSEILSHLDMLYVTVHLIPVSVLMLMYLIKPYLGV